MNVLLICSKRLSASYFEKARAELGDGDIVIDVLAWSPPREPVDEVLRHYLLLGPGQMPLPKSTQSEPSNSEPESHGRPPTDLARAVDAGHPATDSSRRWNRARIKAGLRWRLKRAKRSTAAGHARRLLLGGPSRQLWRRARRHSQAQHLIKNADLFVAIDTVGIRTAWHLARRHPTTGAVVGLTAAAQQMEAHGRYQPSGD